MNILSKVSLAAVACGALLLTPSAKAEYGWHRHHRHYYGYSYFQPDVFYGGPCFVPGPCSYYTPRYYGPSVGFSFGFGGRRRW